MVKSEIKEYYDNLASNYDVDRFGNSYGNYIHLQENQILNQFVKPPYNNIDLACGTGRFLHFAKHGLDISPKMVEISQKKHPNKTVTVGDIEKLKSHENTYENVLAFHLFMHLTKEQLSPILKEVHSIVNTGGLFIFDIPSKQRRKLLNFKTNGWHGSNSSSPQEIKDSLNGLWNIETYKGISFFPIHRIPKNWRKYFIKLDNLLCQSFLKRYASHLVFILKKV